jgi:hypothetical protein
VNSSGKYFRSFLVLWQILIHPTDRADASSFGKRLAWAWRWNHTPLDLATIPITSIPRTFVNFS